jgi:hypothetical protein
MTMGVQSRVRSAASVIVVSEPWRPHGFKSGRWEINMGFTLQAFGPFLHWMTFGVLALAPILAALVIYKLGSLPGSIARSRCHPQAEAISVCGWMGIVTIVLWPIAMVWAYLLPAKPVAGATAGAGDDQTLIAKIQQAARRIADIEARLPETTTKGI